MSIINCKECDHEISTTAKACPKCGAKVPKTKWWLWVPLGLFAFVMAVGSVGSDSPEWKAKSAERDAIKLCWEDQKRKSFDPATARFVAGACEMMEKTYTQRYGSAP